MMMRPKKGLSVRNGARAVEFYKSVFAGWPAGRVVDLFGHHWETGRPLD
jgi:uncharacterized glyoxalase superfamily protein PhnB